MLAEDAADSGANKFPRDGVRALELAFVLEFELAGNGREGRINVRYPRKGNLFADAGRALLGIAHDAFQRGDGQTLAYAGAAVPALVITGLGGRFLPKPAHGKRQRMGEVGGSAGGTNGMDMADNVGESDMGSGELLDEALVAGHPGDGRVVAVFGNFLAAGAADGPERIVIDLAAGHNGNFGVQQLHEAAQNAALRLSAQTEENEIVARKERIHDLRHDGP